jgi:topoisomerase-4 subunit A
MHGNNGSLDDDPPAAMRYTEARLSYFSECMISDIKKDTVDFIENFDGSEVEPTVLPSLLPNLLVNGVSGIAAGYATNIPCFNLSEVIDAIITRIDSPNCRVETIKNVMPCPDFPTGGIILNLEGVDEAYNTGKGKIIIRGKFEQKDKKTLYITEIPYETTKTKIIDQINDLAEKYDSLNISEAYDESDKNGVSICIVLKSGANIDFVKNFLYKNTELQISYNINMIAIKDRKPYLMNILFLLDAFIEHINNIITKATTYDYNKALARKEILVGLIKAVKIVDDIVFIIRHSNDKNTAKLSLISKLGFSENQAEAIVNLRLYRLSNSDVSEMEKELIELDKQIAEHELILNNKDYKNNFIKRKMREYKKIFPSPRKTVYSSEDHIVSIDQTDIVEDKQTLIVVTHDGYLKNISKKSFGMCEYDELKIKEGDIPIAQFESNFKNKLILVTSFGNYISIPVFKIEQTK